MKSWFWIVGWSLSILTITGNGFIIFLVCRRRQLRTKTNAFVVSLAVADFCVGMAVLPLFFVHQHTDPEARLPATEHVFKILLIYASVTNLCSLVLDRYMAVVKPLKYLTFMKRSRVIQMVFLSWAIPVVFITVKASLLFSIETHLIRKIFKWLEIIFFVLVPCLTLIFCFACMLRVICKHDRAMRALVKQLRFNNPVLYRPQDSAAVKIMAIVIGVFLLCCVFRLLCTPGIYFSNNKASSESLVPYMTVLILIFNSAINPIAYALFKRDIKKELKRLICS